MIDSTVNREPTAAAAVGDHVDRKAREEMIRRRAYSLAQERAFAPGHELQDWLWAECEIDRLTAAQRPQHRYGLSGKSTNAATDPRATRAP